MGEVWEAEQTAPVKRRVAVKIIKRGMDTRMVVNRFEAERQALALMDHPSIAKVLDAGETGNGRPYFIMELVRGIRITRYCDHHKLTLQQRLRLFQKVCDAVQHAHQKGVIHRDLKPSNILVSEHGDEPHPTVIDFGVAKATAQPLTEGTLFTQLGQLVGTPEYMSPEQAEMSGQDIDTRSDVYSLGVVLYELLVGLLPFDREELRAAGFGGIQRILSEKTPKRPSTRISEIGRDDSGRLAQARGAEPTTLVRELRGDLDWIVLKALEKDRSRRYESPRRLSEDIGRHLELQPIEARPASVRYRASRFAQRHRLGVGVAAAFVLLLLFFAATMGLQAKRVASERDRANAEADVSREISRFLTELFEVSDPSEARGNSITAREILDRGADRIENELGDQPEVQARLMASIGGTYESLGLFGDADRLLKRAWEQQKEILGEDDPETIATLYRWTDVLFRQGRYREMEPYSREIYERYRRVLGERHPDTVDALSGHGAVLIELGRFEEAREIGAQVLELVRQIHGQESARYYSALYDQEVLYIYEGRYEEAIEGFERVVAGHSRILGPEARTTLTSKSMLGLAYLEAGKLDRAEPLLREVLEGRIEILGPEHDGTLMSVANVGKLLLDQGRTEAAEQLFADLVRTRRRVSAPDNPWTAAALGLHGQALLALGRVDEAEPLLREDVDILRRVFDDAHPDLLAAQRALAQAWVQQQRLDVAERLLAETSSAAQRSAPGQEVTGELFADHARLLMQLGRSADAAAALEQAVAIYQELRPDSTELAELLELQAEAAKPSEAEP